MSQELLERLSADTHKAIRTDLLGQLQLALTGIVIKRTELLNSRYKLQSALREVLELKRTEGTRSMWGSW